MDDPREEHPDRVLEVFRSRNFEIAADGHDRPVQFLTEDQLGEAPIRPGDSVIIANEVAVWIRISERIPDCKQGGTAYNTSLVFRDRKARGFLLLRKWCCPTGSRY